MNRKEHYRQQLPHFQQPEQAYFVTWCLKDAVPPKALSRYSEELSMLKAQLESAVERKADAEKIFEIKEQYRISRRKYIKAFDDLLDSPSEMEINLSAPQNRQAVRETLLFFEGKRLHNYAFCIMPNHVHWVMQVYEKDETGKAVYLQDILQSVKRFSANKINRNENRKGRVWQKESFETTIRNDKHLYHAIEYTLRNPVKAGLVKNVEDWGGTWWEPGAGAANSDSQ